MNQPKKMNRELVITEDELPADVIRAIERGSKVEAIKLLRESTGLGFANAKVLVDKAARRHAPKRTVPGFEETQTSVATLLKTLLLVVLAFAAYRYYFAS